ncbi:MAG: hypothetical protein N2654_02420 [Deltaproteobacteria bacterium]|nr:hypothetical protein [Deltaproteobacteria bacterium]
MSKKQEVRNYKGIKNVFDIRAQKGDRARAEQFLQNIANDYQTFVRQVPQSSIKQKIFPEQNVMAGIDAKKVPTSNKEYNEFRVATEKALSRIQFYMYVQELARKYHTIDGKITEQSLINAYNKARTEITSLVGEDRAKLIFDSKGNFNPKDEVFQQKVRLKIDRGETATLSNEKLTLWDHIEIRLIRHVAVGVISNCPRQMNFLADQLEGKPVYKIYQAEKKPETTREPVTNPETTTTEEPKLEYKPQPLAINAEEFLKNNYSPIGTIDGNGVMTEVKVRVTDSSPYNPLPALISGIVAGLINKKDGNRPPALVPDEKHPGGSGQGSTGSGNCGTDCPPVLPDRE